MLSPDASLYWRYAILPCVAVVGPPQPRDLGLHSDAVKGILGFPLEIFTRHNT